MSSEGTSKIGGGLSVIHAGSLSSLSVQVPEQSFPSVVLTATEDTQETYLKLINQMDKARVLVPDFLFVSSIDGEIEDEAGVA